MKKNPFSTGFIAAAALAASFLSGTVQAQAFASGSDKTVPRLCANKCAQTNERIVVDSNGNATAFWNEIYYDAAGDGYTSLVGARYTASTNSWSAPTRLAYGEGFNGDHHVSIDAKGRARAVWLANSSYYGFGAYTVWIAEYIPNYGWRGPSGAGQENWTASDVVIGSNRNGNVYVTYRASTFTRYSNTTQNRMTTHDSDTNTWSTDVSNTTPVFDKIIGTDGGGAIGIHYRSGKVQAMRYDTGLARWVDTRTLEYAAPGVSFPQLEATSDRSGNVMILYERFNSSTNARQIKSARFQKSNRTWSAKSIPSISGSKLYGTPSIAADRYNNFYATWVQYSGAYTKTISARYSNSGAVWSKPVVISKGSYHTRDAAVAVDYAGNAIYTWGQRTDTGTGSSTGKIFRTTAVRYSNWKWGWPSVIQDAYRIGYKPFIGADNYGRAIVMWTQESGVAGVKEIRSDRLIPK